LEAFFNEAIQLSTIVPINNVTIEYWLATLHQSRRQLAGLRPVAESLFRCMPYSNSHGKFRYEPGKSCLISFLIEFADVERIMS